MRCLPLQSSFLFPALATVLLLCSGGEGVSPTGEIYPPVEEGPEIPLYVGLIESYDASKEDEQLGAVGTVVGAEIALNHINAASNMLPGYSLHHNFINSPCNPYQAADATFKQVLNEPQKLGIIGAGCSPSTQRSALVSQFYNLTQISCIATSPLLANRELYRRYFQLLPPEFESAVGFYQIVTYYGWKRVGVILEDEDLFTKTFFDLRELLTNAGVDVRSFKLHHSELDTDKEEVFEFNNFEGIRIFVILSYESFAVPMLCEAYKRGLWYPQYLFLLNGWYSDGFWKADNDMSDCTAGEIEQALQHTLTVDILPNARVLGDDWSADDLDITNGEFYEAEKAHISTPSPPLNLTITNFLSQYCYDATWAFALVLNQTISDLESNDSLNKLAREEAGNRNSSDRFWIEDFEYNNSVVADQMMRNWDSVAFTGVTGHVSFVNGTRELLRIRITQYLEHESGNMMDVEVGFLEKFNKFSVGSIVDSIVWRDGEPHDGSVESVIDPIHPGVTFTFMILACFGIVFAIICLLLTFVLREKLVIKLSSPKLNYLIGFGAILLYLSVILVAIPLREGNGDLATSLCYTTPWFTAIGYSLCYGTILVKMFRTWYIFNNPIANKKQVHDWMLILMVLCFVVIDVVIMAVYTGLEASGEGATLVVNREREITITGPQEVVTHHSVYICNSIERRVTLGILYGYKGVLQVVLQ
jgi:gamma-aminobutyric acid type B receptor